MEQWQKDYLTKNASRLLDETICNVALLARLRSDGILAKVDVDSINSKSAEYDKVSTLYEIVTTRENGYVGMAKALAECCQSGACKIFTIGLTYHLCRPEINVNILGEIKPLSAYLDAEELDEVMKIMRESLSSKQLIEFYEKSQSDNIIIRLVKQTIPDDPPYYIPRSLFKKLVVNKKLFQLTTCPDIFLFKGIGLFQLSELVKPQRVASSSSQLHGISSRFIRLENEADWEDIRDITQHPLHLIKCEENVCILERTTGGSRVIHDYLGKYVKSEKTNELSTLVKEDAFIENVANEKSAGICICDSPGMGKSLLLAKLASKTAAHFPNKLVVFIQLSKFIDNLFSAETLPEATAQFSRAALLNFLSLSPLAAVILDKILAKGSTHMELFLDGFDEVQHQHVQFTKTLLSEMAFSFPNTRVYVTSRPHLRYELEESLEVISYDILPFTRENQIDFLVNSWTGKTKKLCQEKNAKFAGHLLKELSKSISEQELNITGVPLTCRLLAEVYSREAQMYSNPNRTLLLEDCCQFKSSLPELYKMFVDHAFSKFENQPPEVTLSVKEYHTWIAIRTIFPEIVKTYLNEYESKISHPIAELCSSTGLLSTCCLDGSNSDEFIHRTFAEYFVSEYLTNVLNELQGLPLQEFQKRLTKPLFEFVLKTTKDEGIEIWDHVFLYPTVVYFFNYFTTGMSIPSEDHFIPNIFLATIPPRNLYALLHRCLWECYNNIFDMIQNIFLVVNTNSRELYKVELIPATAFTEPEKLHHLLYMTAEHCNTNLANKLFRFFLECFDCDLNKVCKDLPQDYYSNPLHIAVRRMDFELVQFFASYISLENWKLIQMYCNYSYKKSLQVLEKKIEICEFLLSRNKSLIKIDYTDYNHMHLEIIKLLVRLGVNPCAIKERQTVVHRAARYMIPSDFHELTRFLIDECHSCHLFMKNESEWKWPLQFILSKQKSIEKCTLEKILGIPGINVNEVDDSENTLLFSAVKARQRVEILERLITLGINFRAVNRYGQCAIHLAAENGDIQTIQFLLGRGLDPYQVDKAGNSFLHYCAWHPISSEQYGEIIEFIVSAGLIAIFHVRNVLEQLPIHVAIRDVEVEEKTLRLFQENGIDFNSTDKDNWSLLMYAALGRRSVNLLRTLIKMGVDITIQDRDCNTFAHCLFKSNTMECDEDMKKLLIHSRRLKPARVKGDYVEYFVSHGVGNNHNYNNIRDLRGSYGNIIKVSRSIERNVINDSDYSAEKNRCRQFWRILKEMNVDVAENEEPEILGEMTEYYSFKDYQTILEMLNEVDPESKLLGPVNKFGDTPLHMALQDSAFDTELLNFVLGKPVDANVLKGSFANEIEMGKTLVHAAKANGRLHLVKTLIQLGADVMVQDNKENTFAHHLSKYCSAEEYHEIMELLQENGYQKIFQILNKDGASPLHLAVLRLGLSESTLDHVKSRLVDTRIFDINSADRSGKSLLTYAVQGCRSVEFLKTLMEMGADVMTQDDDGNTIAHWMSQYYYAEKFQEVLQLIIDSGYQKIFQAVNKKGDSPLHRAVDRQELSESTMFLIKCQLIETKFCDINATNESGRSPLMYAIIKKRSVAFLRTMMEMGADVMAQDNEGNTIVHLLLRHNYGKECHEVLQLLIDNGHQKIFQKANKKGVSLLHLAIYHIELSESTMNLIKCQLIETGLCNINATDTNGMSPMMHAIASKKGVAFLRTMIDMGADIMAQDNNGNTMAHFMSWYYSAEKFHEVMQLIIDRGQHKIFQVANKKGETPLHCAVYRLELSDSTMNLIKCRLIESGLCDINETDINISSYLVENNARQGDVALLKIIMEMGTDVMAQDKEGNTMAHWMSEDYTATEYHEVLQLLIESGHQKIFQVANKKGETPFHLAIYHIELSESTMNLIKCRLIETGLCDINARNESGCSPLVYAITGKRSVAFLRTMMEMGADVMAQDDEGDTIAHLMSEDYSTKEYHEVMQLIINNGHQKIFQIANKKGESPLHWAVHRIELSESTMNLIKCQLIENGLCDINARNNDGDSLLMYAITGKRSVAFLRIMMDMGADVMAQNNEGDTIAHFMSENYSPEDYHKIINLLFEKGKECVLFVPNVDGITAFHLAVYFLELLPESLDYLFVKNTALYRGRFNLSIFSTSGESVLHFAIEGKRSLQFVQHLVKLGADWSVTSNHKTNLAHCSASYGLFNQLKYFVELGCNINALDNDGDNVLQCAVHDAPESDHIGEMVEFLLEKGANKHNRNKEGKTAYTYALEKGITDDGILKALQ